MYSTKKEDVPLCWRAFVTRAFLIFWIQFSVSLFMSKKYKFHDPKGIYFVTMTTVGWLDLFTRPSFAAESRLGLRVYSSLN